MYYIINAVFSMSSGSQDVAPFLDLFFECCSFNLYLWLKRQTVFSNGEAIQWFTQLGSCLFLLCHPEKQIFRLSEILHLEIVILK